MRPPDWTTACPDWETRIVARQSLIPAPLFEDEAEAALDVFKSLRMVDVPGQPTFGEASEPFVFEFVAAIFGAYDRKSARRFINEFLLLISKKNAKSTIAAGIMLTALIRNWRHLQELLILAPTMEVANNSFTPAAAMVRADPDLTDLLQVIDHQRLIRHRVTRAELKVIAADNDVVAGKKAGFVLVEELWLFGKRPGAKDMLDEATGGLSARPEGFVVFLTTHSDEAPDGVFKDKLAYARDVRDGLIEDRSFLPVLYEWPTEMLEAEVYRNPDFFYVTNPNIRRSVSREWLENKLAKELRGDEDGDGIQVFLAKHLNVEIGLKLRRDRWRGADYWEGALDPSLDLDEIKRRAEVCTVGIDGGGDDDLFGIFVVGRCRETKAWLGWGHAWCQKEVLDRRKDIAPRLRDFMKDGDLTLCETVDQHYHEAAEIVADLKAAGLLPEKAAVGMDRWGSLDDMITALSDLEIAEDQLAGIAQGAPLTGTVVDVPMKLKGKTLLHGHQPMMSWCVSNAKAEKRGNSVLITKQKAGSAKIDPVLALLAACKLMNPYIKAAGGPSVYKTRGFLTI